MNEYGTGPSVVHAVRKVNVLALSIVPLRDTARVLLRRQVTAVRREGVQMYADPGQVADVLAAARVDPTSPLRSRSCAVIPPSAPPLGRRQGPRPPANLTGVLYPAGRILLAGIIEEGA